MLRTNAPKSTKAVLTVLAAVLCLCVFTAPARAGLMRPQEIESEEAVSYDTVTVQRGTFETMENNLGREYYPLSYALSYDHDGARFVEYKVELGDEVKKGDVLAVFRMDSSDSELARKELAVTHAEEETARGIRDREEQISEAKKLRAQSSGYGWVQQNLQVERLEVELERYRLQQEYQTQQLRDALEEATADLTITAPIDGVITRVVLKAPGDVIKRNLMDAFDVLIEMRSEEERLMLMDSETLNFRYNMPVEVGEEVGRVVAAPDLVPGVQSGQILVEMEPVDGEIKMSTRTVIGVVKNLDNVLLVPRNAVTKSGNQYYVTKMTNGVLQKRYVTVADMNNNDYWVLQGVDEGDILVTNY